MTDKPKTAAALIPPEPTLPSWRAAVKDCQACPLYENATPTVFGEGPADAKLMLVGETPGDQEDRQGRPCVGPAGKRLDRCLETVGIERDKAYASNVVKHFKWTPRGKRRIHSKPSAKEIRVCEPWLLAEIAAVRPQVLVCLGATAAQALLGADFRVDAAARFVRAVAPGAARAGDRPPFGAAPRRPGSARRGDRALRRGFAEGGRGAAGGMSGR